MAVSSVAPNRTDVGNTLPEVTVHRGDTLSGIAARHGVSLAALERANPQIANPNLILPGQQVHLPGAMHDNAASAPSVASAAGLPTSGAHANAAAIAERYLGQNASTLEATHGGDGLPMQAGVDTHHSCANFVSAVLTQAGLLSPSLHTNSVAQLDHTLRSQGWTPVSAANARPGDVVIIRGGGVSHTEIVSGPGRMIGSNNANRDGSQRITHNNLGWAVNHGAVILRPPAGAGAGGTAGTASASTTPAVSNATTLAAAPRSNSVQGTWIARALPAAQEVQRLYGVPVSVTLAQGALESGWGRHAPGGNYFGVKSHGRAGGSSQTTTEFVNGRAVTTRDAFRNYANLRASAMDFGRFLAENPRYAEAFTHSDDPVAFSREVARAGYATDPHYAQQIQAIMRSNNLAQFDAR